MKRDNDLPTTDTTEIKQLIDRVKQGKLDPGDAGIAQIPGFGPRKCHDSFDFVFPSSLSEKGEPEVLFPSIGGQI